MKPTYLCDYRQNEVCKKTSCAWNTGALYRVCYTTADPARAVLNEKKEPIEAPLSFPPKKSLLDD